MIYYSRHNFKCFKFDHDNYSNYIGCYTGSEIKHITSYLQNVLILIFLSFQDTYSRLTIIIYPQTSKNDTCMILYWEKQCMSFVEGKEISHFSEILEIAFIFA
jgi:hypothetical protein